MFVVWFDTIFGGGLVVPKYTSYVTGSPSGSPPVQFKVILIDTFIDSLAGYGLLGSYGGLFSNGFDNDDIGSPNVDTLHKNMNRIPILMHFNLLLFLLIIIPPFFQHINISINILPNTYN